MKKNLFALSMKHGTWYMVHCTLILALGLSFTACSDDDADKNGTEQRSDVDPLDNDEARTAFRWLCALTDAQTIDANWQSKTYEPTIGVASENNEYTRIVVVETLDEAKVSFASIADKETSELGGKVTVSGGAAGTMTWEPSKAGAENLAVVTVNSRIMPHLQKLVYCTQDQIGQNGGLFGNNMKGTPYYRFGDVIQDPDGYYWVCVRPCFAPNEADKKLYSDTKGDSHWINIFNAAQTGDKKGMPEANVITKWNELAKYNNQTIKLPTKLAYDRKHIHNLTKLLWALLKPDAYAQANTGVSDAALGGFPYKYNCKKFVEAVAQFWNEPIDGRTIWEKLFNHTYEEMKQLFQTDFIYQGYSWTIGETGYCWIYSAQEYTPYYVGKESNDKKQFNFVQGGFDVTHYAQTPNSKPLPIASYGKDDYGKYYGRWVVRYKTGEQLMTAGKFSYWSAITSKDGKQQDVYRYNAKKGIPAGENVEAETEDTFKESGVITGSTVKVGNLIGNDGKFYASLSDATASAAKPIAIVCYVNRNSTIETGANYNALALSLNMDPDYCSWGEKGKDCGGDSVSQAPSVTSYPLNGLARTKSLAAGCNAGHTHTAAQKCANYDNARFTAATRQSKGFSDWFLPSISQWQKIMVAMGVTDWNDTLGYLVVTYDTMKATIRKVYADAGVADYFDSVWTGGWWSSTQYGKAKANTVRFSWNTVYGKEKDDSALLLPMIAFRAE